MFIKKNKSVSYKNNFKNLFRKFLKYLFLNIKHDLKHLKIDIKKFDQCKEVRNLNVPHNRDNFINLTIMDLLINNNIIEFMECQKIFNSNNIKLKDFMSKKIKTLYHFDFLRSSYFRNWLNDPIKIFSVRNFFLFLRINFIITKIVRNSLTIRKIFSRVILRIMIDTKSYYYTLLAIFCFIFKIIL